MRITCTVWFEVSSLGLIALSVFPLLPPAALQAMDTLAPGAPGAKAPRPASRWQTRRGKSEGSPGSAEQVGVRPGDAAALGQVSNQVNMLLGSAVHENMVNIVTSAIGQATNNMMMSGQAVSASGQASSSNVVSALGQVSSSDVVSAFGQASRASPAVAPITTCKNSTRSQLCRRSAAVIAKYSLQRRSVMCCERGVDRINRDGLDLNPNDVHHLASFIRKAGCDVRELDRCVCVQLTPGDRREVEHNVRLCETTDLFPSMDKVMQEMMSMTTLIGSHCNYVSRCYYYGVQCNHPEHCSSEGCMNLAYLEEVDEEWANAIRHGTMTTILSHAVRTEDPEGMHAVMAADNLKHGANLVEHTLQLITRLVNYCRAEEVVSSCVRRETVLKRFIGTGSLDAVLAEDLFAFASRYGYSHIMGELEDFRAHYMSDGRRDVEASFYSKVSTLPLIFLHVCGGLVKAQLTCPEQNLIKKVCRYISGSEVEQLKEGKHGFNKATKCENFLREWRSYYQRQLEQLDATTRTRVLALLDSQTIRILLGKKCKYQDLQGVSDALVEEMGKTFGESLPIVKFQCASETNLRSSTRVVERSSQEEAETTAMVEFAGSRAKKTCELAERGIIEGCYLKVIGEIPNLGGVMIKEDVFKVIDVSDELIGMRPVNDADRVPLHGYMRIVFNVGNASASMVLLCSIIFNGITVL